VVDDETQSAFYLMWPPWIRHRCVRRTHVNCHLPHAELCDAVAHNLPQSLQPISCARLPSSTQQVKPQDKCNICIYPLHDAALLQYPARLLLHLAAVFWSVTRQHCTLASAFSVTAVCSLNFDSIAPEGFHSVYHWASRGVVPSTTFVIVHSLASDHPCSDLQDP